MIYKTMKKFSTIRNFKAFFLLSETSNHHHFVFDLMLAKVWRSYQCLHLLEFRIQILF